MYFLYKRNYNADLTMRSIEELIDMLNEDNPTKHEYIQMIIRAQFLLNTSTSIADQLDAQTTVNQIKEAFRKDYPEEYDEWCGTKNG